MLDGDGSLLHRTTIYRQLDDITAFEQCDPAALSTSVDRDDVLNGSVEIGQSNGLVLKFHFLHFIRF